MLLTFTSSGTDTILPVTTGSMVNGTLESTELTVEILKKTNYTTIIIIKKMHIHMTKFNILQGLHQWLLTCLFTWLLIDKIFITTY